MKDSLYWKLWLFSKYRISESGFYRLFSSTIQWWFQFWWKIYIFGDIRWTCVFWMARPSSLYFIRFDFLRFQKYMACGYSINLSLSYINHKKLNISSFLLIIYMTKRYKKNIFFVLGWSKSYVRFQNAYLIFFLFSSCLLCK